VDVSAEKLNGDFVRGLITETKVTACHDVSDGGILVAVAEMALAGKIGATLQVPEDGPPAHAWLFGEDQGRYIVTTTDAKGLLAAAEEAGVPAMQIGLTGGEGLSLIGGEAETALDQLRQIHEGWLPDYMAGP
jgi:phosphoribosylformylglycinamidine synthase